MGGYHAMGGAEPRGRGAGGPGPGAGGGVGERNPECGEIAIFKKNGQNNYIDI